MGKVKKQLRSIFVKLFARKLFQPLFKKLHWLSLRGMNYGAGYSPLDSGEYYFLNYIKKQYSSKIIIFDIGANIGQYALLANKILGANYFIYSFEPTKKAYEKLISRTAEIDQVKTYNFGMGSSIKTVDIYYESPGSVQSSIVDKKKSSFSEKINLSTVNSFCKEYAIGKINVLKIDVEGYEYDVLLGAADMLNMIDYIQFEFGNKQISNRNYLKDFIHLLSSFKIYRLLQDGMVEINGDAIYEVFQTSNYVAINKNTVQFFTKR